MENLEKSDKIEIKEIEDFANRARIDAVKMIYGAKSGHLGGSLSCLDILSVLYLKVMNITPEMKENRDRFILSKGHASPAIYSVLGNSGFFDKKEFSTFRKINSKLQGHPACHYINGIEVSTGSLGQGLSIGVGMAMGLKLDKKTDRVFVLTGDGELQEGSVWEAFMNAGHRKLDNLTTIIDRNMLQIDGEVEKIKSLEPLGDKLKAFKWEVVEIDGHNIEEIYNALTMPHDKPLAIIAHTIKGKGVSFAQNQAGWHGKAPSDEEFNVAMKDLGGDVCEQ